MADNPQLDAFLADNAAQEAPAAPAAPTPPESPPAEAKPSATPTAPAKAKETPEPDEDTEPPAPQLGEAVVPRRALEDERHKRQDWKSVRSGYETQHASLCGSWRKPSGHLRRQSSNSRRRRCSRCRTPARTP